MPVWATIKGQTPLLLLGAVIVAGVLRMALVGPDAGSLKDEGDARRWATCLGARRVVATGTTVTVARTADAPYLAFRAIGQVSARLIEVPGKPGTIPSTLPPGTSVEITKAAPGDFQFRFDDGKGALVVAEGHTRSLLDVAPVKFAPVAGIPYTIILAQDTAATVSAERALVLPAGAEGRMEVGTGQSLETVQPLALNPWLIDRDSRLQPINAVARTGIADLEVDTVKVSAPGAGTMLSACAESADEVPTPIGVTAPVAGGVGSGSITLAIPYSFQQASSWRIVHTLKLAIVDVNGDYRAYGAFSMIGRLYSGLSALALTAVLLTWLLRLRHTQLNHGHKGRTQNNLAPDASRWLSSLFIGPDRDPSLSLFQVFFWTVITVWGWLYVFIATGSLLSLTSDMMVLLGIAGTGSVLARWITNYKQTSTSQTATSTGDLTEFSFWQILSSNGNFDLLKLQVFIFTLLVGAYVVSRIAVAGAFPSLDANTLLLLGVSQGVYIGGKLTGASALADVQAVKLELDTRTEALEQSRKVIQALNDKRTAGTSLSIEETKKLAELEAEVAASTKAVADLKSRYADGLKKLGLQT